MDGRPNLRLCMLVIWTKEPICQQGLPRLVLPLGIDGFTITIYTCLEAFWATWENKSDTKLTVLMCCQIFDRKSVAPSSGDF